MLLAQADNLLDDWLSSILYIIVVQRVRWGITDPLARKGTGIRGLFQS
jgi:hypothetical protein